MIEPAQILGMDKYLPTLLIAYSLHLSGISCYWQLAARHRTRAGVVIQTLAAASMIAFAFLATPWAFTSYYLRYVVLGAFRTLSSGEFRVNCSAVLKLMLSG